MMERNHGNSIVSAPSDHASRVGGQHSGNVGALPSVENARAGAKHMYHDDRVLLVMMVVDSVGSFVEWIER